MILSATKYVNARTPVSNELASTQLANPSYLSPAQTIDIVDVVIGQRYNGSAIWYLGNDRQYYWSGAFSETRFALPEKSFAGLQPAEKTAVLEECVDVLYKELKKGLIGFNGMAIGHDSARELALVLYLEPGTRTPFKQITFKGFEIPVAIDEVERAEAIGIGDSVSPWSVKNSGSIGFYFSGSEGNHYLVTNYHVVCNDLLRKKIFAYDSTKDPLIEVSMQEFADGKNGQKIGQVLFGCLDDFKDYAVVRVSRHVANRRDHYFFTAFGDLSDFFKDFQPDIYTVQMFGAESQFAERAVQGLNKPLPISYRDVAGHLAEHDMFGLIQLGKMTVKGDSGSPIIRKNKLVGLIVAQDSKYSYAIPIQAIVNDIRKRLKLETLTL